ncbi:MAG: hypothetical protein BWK73_14190 [Thiothrix lacustris]|uniref:Uncharacterized protein n=1 Tax=Thiothrix lacustris TaxID=525917 RepID=A0A1Y1QSS9_9GAMM|nr:MAG: hypothetical protein BWK73_14190 [Thiothrix lacustris]
MKPWLFGNTTVRSPLRLRDGLAVLRHSALHGNLRGKEADCAFYELLGAAGIVDPKGDETCSVSRKWRSALGQMGFLYPKLQGQAVTLQNQLEQTGDESLSFMEMALFVQRTSSATPAPQLAGDILAFRVQREAAPYKRKFDDAALQTAQQQDGIQANSLKDYADTNLRYLKATGLFLRKGRGIAFAPEKRSVIHALAQETLRPSTALALLQGLTNGAALPTDEIAGAWEALHDVSAALQQYGESPPISADLNQIADIASLTATLQAQLDQRKETDYAHQQAGQVSDILDYLALLTKRNRKLVRENDDILEIPSSEAPAYFEWAVWRAFLAINSLVNPSWKALRFAIDRIPLALSDFSCLLEAFADHPSELLPHLKLLLRDCRMYANKDAPDWKQKISQLAQQLAAKQVPS